MLSSEVRVNSWLQQNQQLLPQVDTNCSHWFRPTRRNGNSCSAENDESTLTNRDEWMTARVSNLSLDDHNEFNHYRTRRWNRVYIRIKEAPISSLPSRPHPGRLEQQTSRGQRARLTMWYGISDAVNGAWHVMPQKWTAALKAFLSCRYHTLGNILGPLFKAHPFDRGFLKQALRGDMSLRRGDGPSNLHTMPVPQRSVFNHILQPGSSGKVPQ